jgi:hypothetical protein
MTPLRFSTVTPQYPTPLSEIQPSQSTPPEKNSTDHHIARLASRKAQRTGMARSQNLNAKGNHPYTKNCSATALRTPHLRMQADSSLHADHSTCKLQTAFFKFMTDTGCWERRSRDPQFHRFECAQHVGSSSTSPTSFPSENLTQLNFLPRLLPPGPLIDSLCPIAKFQDFHQGLP